MHNTLQFHLRSHNGEKPYRKYEMSRSPRDRKKSMYVLFLFCFLPVRFSVTIVNINRWFTKKFKFFLNLSEKLP